MENGTGIKYHELSDRACSLKMLCREHGDPSKSEYTVVKVEAFNGINSYLSELSNTDIKSFADVIAFNDKNPGTEGASPGDVPAFPSGQAS